MLGAKNMFEFFHKSFWFCNWINTIFNLLHNIRTNAPENPVSIADAESDWREEYGWFEKSDEAIAVQTFSDTNNEKHQFANRRQIEI